jgi:hypothetical protein
MQRFDFVKISMFDQALQLSVDIISFTSHSARFAVSSDVDAAAGAAAWTQVMSIWTGQPDSDGSEKLLLGLLEEEFNELLAPLSHANRSRARRIFKDKKLQGRHRHLFSSCFQSCGDADYHHTIHTPFVHECPR